MWWFGCFTTRFVVASVLVLELALVAALTCGIVCALLPVVLALRARGFGYHTVGRDQMARLLPVASTAFYC